MSHKKAKDYKSMLTWKRLKLSVDGSFEVATRKKRKYSFSYRKYSYHKYHNCWLCYDDPWAPEELLYLERSWWTEDKYWIAYKLRRRVADVSKTAMTLGLKDPERLIDKEFRRRVARYRQGCDKFTAEYRQDDRQDDDDKVETD